MRESSLVVVGGGIAGLSAAWSAGRAAAARGASLRVTVLEADEVLGGKIRTDTRGPVPVEWGPDAFVAAKPEGRRLAAELGIEDELVEPSPMHKTHLWLRGRMRELPPGLAMGVPTGLVPLTRAVREGIVGPIAALRAAVEPVLPGRRAEGDRSVGEVARRRLGRRVAERLVEPLLGGVYGAPADEVSIRVALPQLASARSLLVAVAKGPRSAGPVFLTPRGGMGRFVERLSEELSGADVRTATRAHRVAAAGGRYRIVTDAGDVDADAVVLAVPAPSAAALLEESAPGAALALRRIRFRTSVVVHLVYPGEALPHRSEAWGFLRAPEEDGVVAAATFVGTKWPHLREEGVRVRAVVNAADAVAMPDDVLRDRVRTEVGRLVGMRRLPDEVAVFRWSDAMPVYEPGHADRVALARRSVPPRIALAGASYEGVGVPDCIRTGTAAAEALVASLAEAARA